MKYGYTADEIFELAEDIEKEGVAFYKKAATLTRDKTCKKLFQDLAAAEEIHVKKFHEMRMEITDGDELALENHTDQAVSMFLKSVARGSVFQDPKESANQLQECHSEEDILSIAINNELDTILYFYGLNDLLLNSKAKPALDFIIKEERDHIVWLATHHAELKS